MPTALICGGGVAGLSTALHLKRDGWTVKLFEKEPEIRTAGVGLNIWPNGVRVLSGLGLGESYLAAAAAMNRWWALDSDGTMRTDADVSGWAAELGAPITGVRRRRLNALLAAGLDEHELIFDHMAERYSQTVDEITVHFADGSTETGDLLVAADGIGSKLREHLLDAQPAFTTEGFFRWRGVFECAAAGVPTDVQADVFGVDGHFGWIPIDETHAYWYGTVAGCSTFDDVYRVYRTWTDTPVPQIIDSSDPETRIGREIAHYTEHLPYWADGRATLIGDSAHPMYPGMAQGANQALIEGQTLARLLTETDDVPAALQAFQAERQPIADKMVEYSRLHFDFEQTRAEYATAGVNLQIQRYLEFE
jgi:FAD-dependent urate hydroxylase